MSSCWSRTSSGSATTLTWRKPQGSSRALDCGSQNCEAKDGTVWYVRNGEVVRVGNYSQGGPGEPPTEAEPAENASYLGRYASGHNQLPARVASTVIVVPVSALETGQFTLASCAAASNSSAVMPGTTPVTVSLMPVIPGPGSKVTSACGVE